MQKHREQKATRNISSPSFIPAGMNSEQNSFSKYLQEVPWGLDHLEDLEFLEDPRRDSFYHKIYDVIENKS